MTDIPERWEPGGRRTLYCTIFRLLNKILPLAPATGAQIEVPTIDAEVPEVSAEELKRRVDAGESVTVLDTRRPADFEAWHVSGPNVRSVNVPFTAFLDGENPVDAVPAGVRGPLVTCCAKGISSLFAAAFLAREGWVVEALADGMEGWVRPYEARQS